MTRRPRWGWALLALAGCLEAPDGGFPAECAVSADCNAGAGEVCDEGVCWGDPPDTAYSVVIGPPADRAGELAPTELTSIDISPSGQVAALTLGDAVALRGRVEASCEACVPGLAVPATVQVRRPSGIPGAPDLLASVSVKLADDGVDSFTLPVPALAPGDAPYQLSVLPSTTEPLAPGGPPAAQLVPPLRLDVGAEQLGAALTLTLGDDATRTLRGRVTNAAGFGLAGVPVSAVGRVEPLRPAERVSTLALTDAAGGFELRLAADAPEIVDVVAVPRSGGLDVTLVTRDVFPGAVEPVQLRMPALAGAARLALPVRHVDTSGREEPVVAARVRMTMVEGTGAPGDTEATFVAEAETDADGLAELAVLAGSALAPRTYVAEIVPAAGARSASSFVSLEVGPDDVTLPSLLLPLRSALAGRLVDAGGEPVSGVTVQASPALGYVWSLDAAAQRQVFQREPGKTTTSTDGSFVLWVDPATGDLPAAYVPVCIPGELAPVPRWEFAAADGSLAADLGDLRLPEAAFVRGTVRDPDGRPVAGAEVLVYEVVVDRMDCAAPNAPVVCQQPAVLRGRGVSDADGTVRLVLPRP